MALVRATSIIIPFILHRLLAMDRMDYLDVVTIEAAPFLALVLCNNSKYFCTGTIVHEEYVLTAAHCFYNIGGTLTEKDTSVFVVTGTNRLIDAKKDIQSGLAQIRQSKKILMFENYHYTENFLGDLALVRLQQPLNMNNRTRKAPMDPEYHTKNLRTLETKLEKTVSKFDIQGLPFSCSVYGFGKVYSDQDNANDATLKKQTLVVNKLCSCLDEVWSLRWHANVMKASFICEGDEHGLITLSGLCSGDQGAPMICDSFLRGIGTATFSYADRDGCKLNKKGHNDCGSLDTMYVISDLCYYSQWLGWHIHDFPVLTEYCDRY